MARRLAYGKLQRILTRIGMGRVRQRRTAPGHAGQLGRCRPSPMPRGAMTWKAFVNTNWSFITLKYISA